MSINPGIKCTPSITIESLSLIERLITFSIAGITKAPYSLNPYANYEECMNRRDLCLWYMHDQGKITDEEYAEALEEVGNIDKKPKLEGKNMSMVVSPKGAAK